MKFVLQPFDQAAFDAAYAAFHTPGASLPIKVATIEYMAALRATFAEGSAPFNMSLTAIANMPPDVASYAKYGDYREFTPGPAFLHEVEAVVVGLHIGHWFHG